MNCVLLLRVIGLGEMRERSISALRNVIMIQLKFAFVMTFQNARI